MFIGYRTYNRKNTTKIIDFSNNSWCCSSCITISWWKFDLICRTSSTDIINFIQFNIIWWFSSITKYSYFFSIIKVMIICKCKSITWYTINTRSSSYSRYFLCRKYRTSRRLHQYWCSICCLCSTNCNSKI